MGREAGADMIHLDVMDGHFVPNLTLGRRPSPRSENHEAPDDVHLMVENPGFFILSSARPERLALDPCRVLVHLHRDISLIKELGGKRESPSPRPPRIHALTGYLKELDYILVCRSTGVSGAKFVESTAPKDPATPDLDRRAEPPDPIEVDGGVGPAIWKA